MTQQSKILKLKNLELAYQAAQFYGYVPNLGEAPTLIRDYGIDCKLDRMEDVLFIYMEQSSSEIISKIMELIKEL